MSETPDTPEPIAYQQPLEMLRTVSQRLLDRQMPATQSRLDELYTHLKGAIGDICDQVTRQVSEALSLSRDNFPEEAEQVQQVVSEVQAEVEQALAEVKETFFAARSFQELQANLGDLSLFESRLSTSMLRLEEAVNVAEQPEIYGGKAFEPAPSLTEAVEHLSIGLEHVAAHLKSGEKESLERALEAVEQAQKGLQAALAEMG
jgi:hypothetical protein